MSDSISALIVTKYCIYLIMKLKSIICLLKLVLFLFFPLCVLSQTNKNYIDSLKFIIQSKVHDSLRLKAITKLAFEIKYENENEVVSLCKDAVIIGLRIKKFSEVATAYKILGIVDDEHGRFKEGIKNYITATKFFNFSKDDLGLAKTEANIGILYTKIGQQKEAIYYFMNSMRVFDKYKIYPAMSKIYQALGGIYFDKRQYDSCLKYFLMAQNVTEKMGLKDPELYGNLSNVYSAINQKDKRTNYLNMCISSLESNNDTTAKYYFWIYNLGFSELNNKNVTKGLSLLNKSISGMERYNEMYNNKGIQMYNSSATAFYSYGKFKEAYLIQKKAFNMADSLFKNSNIEQINLLKAQYEDEKKEINIANLKKEKELIDKQLKQEATLKYELIGLLVLAIITLLITYKSFKQKKKDNQIIKYQKLQVDEKNKEITDSINYAKKIQEVILPSNEKWKLLLPDSFVLYLPKDIVAGDFYWLEEDDNYIYVAAADCTGHGVPGAMMSVVCSTALTKAVLEEKICEPSLILNRTREIVIHKLNRTDKEMKDGMDICLVRLNKKQLTKDIIFSGANRSLMIFDENEFKIIKADKQPIGMYFNASDFTQHQISVSSESTLYLFTDGYSDQFGGDKNKKFGGKALTNKLNSICKLDMIAQKELLNQTIIDWKNNNEQTDDITFIGLKLV